MSTLIYTNDNMFTGIIQGKFPITTITKKEGLHEITIQFPEELVRDLKLGASVAVNGACLTVAEMNAQQVRFDVMEESLQKTTLGLLQEGELVNIERSAKMGDEIGGHVMSGHIVSTGEIIALDVTENNHVVTIKIDPTLQKYIFEKGFIGLDGASLTVVNLNQDEATFDVWLIPETLRLTAYSERQVGDFINIEIDSRTQVIVDTVERMKL